MPASRRSDFRPLHRSRLPLSGGSGAAVPAAASSSAPRRRLRRAFALAAAALVAAPALFAADADAGPRRGGKHRGGYEDPFDILNGLAEYFLGGHSPPASSWGSDVVEIGLDAPLRVQVGPFPITVRVRGAAGTALSLRVERVAGQLPDLLWAQDSDGRAFSPATRVEGRTLVVDHIPVHNGDGVDVILTPTRTTKCVVDITAVAGELETVPDPAASPWEPGVLVANTGAGAPCIDYESLGLRVIESGDGYVLLELPADRRGFEWLDSELFTQSCGGPAFEPDSYAEPPEGSQTNQAVVGSEFGRSYNNQPAIRSIFTPPRTRGLVGTGVTIAVLDTGIDMTHPRLRDRIAGGIDLVDDDADPSEEANGIDDDGDGNADDGYGHGTLVAGIALAVAPNAKILPVRVLDDEGLGTATRVAAGVRWAVQAGAKVINMSLGTRAWSSVLEGAVQEAVAAGAIVVVSAGNDGDRWAVDFPGDVPGVIAVGALGLKGRPANFTNGGRLSTVFAPGVKVVGTWPGGTWAQATGTSFAAPLASGAAAVLKQMYPGATATTFRARVAPRFRLDMRSLTR